MQTALFITDCSVDSALSIRTWLADNAPRPLRLTVVHPYDIPPGEPLHKAVCKPAKADAQARLTRWTDMFGEGNTTYLTTHVLFASPEQALAIHRMIRRYDHWFVNECLVSGSVFSLCQLSDNEHISLLRELQP